VECLVVAWKVESPLFSTDALYVGLEQLSAVLVQHPICSLRG
jgi:hypothetical protein